MPWFCIHPLLVSVQTQQHGAGASMHTVPSHQPTTRPARQCARESHIPLHIFGRRCASPLPKPGPKKHPWQKPKAPNTAPYPPQGRCCTPGRHSLGLAPDGDGDRMGRAPFSPPLGSAPFYGALAVATPAALTELTEML